jgi:hypothetical protein
MKAPLRYLRFLLFKPSAPPAANVPVHRPCVSDGGGWTRAGFAAPSGAKCFYHRLSFWARARRGGIIGAAPTELTFLFILMLHTCRAYGAAGCDGSFSRGGPPSFRLGATAEGEGGAPIATATVRRG